VALPLYRCSMTTSGNAHEFLAGRSIRLTTRWVHGPFVAGGGPFLDESLFREHDLTKI
jgi:hypothetical protein